MYVGGEEMEWVALLTSLVSLATSIIAFYTAWLQYKLHKRQREQNSKKE